MGMVNRYDLTSASKILWILCLTATCGVVTLKEDIGTATMGVCPKGWMHYETSCYFGSPSTTHVDYDRAQSECEELRADLVSLNDIDEFQYVIGNSEVNTFWIGLLRTCCTSCPPDDHTTDWMWQDGTKLTTNNWDKLDGEPTGNSDCGCVKNDKLGDDPCSAKHPYVCEKEARPPKPLPPSPRLCSTKWKYYSQSCYWVSDALDYSSAQEKCDDYDAKLLSINNEEEYRFVSYFIPTTAFWIGLLRECGTSCPPDNHTTDWMWQDGTQLTIDKWNKDAGEPTGNSQCGSFEYYKFVVASCGESKAYICEKPADIPVNYDADVEPELDEMDEMDELEEMEIPHTTPSHLRLWRICVIADKGKDSVWPVFTGVFGGLLGIVIIIAVIAYLFRDKLKKHITCENDNERNEKKETSGSPETVPLTKSRREARRRPHRSIEVSTADADSQDPKQQEMSVLPCCNQDAAEEECTLQIPTPNGSEGAGEPTKDPDSENGKNRLLSGGNETAGQTAMQVANADSREDCQLLETSV